MVKTCTKCNKEKDIELFVKDKRLLSGYISTCLNCKKVLNKEHNKKYRENNKNKKRNSNK